MSCCDKCSSRKNRGSRFSLSGTLSGCMGGNPASNLFPVSDDHVKPTEITPQSGVISNQYKPEPDTGYDGFDTSDGDFHAEVTARIKRRAARRNKVPESTSQDGPASRGSKEPERTSQDGPASYAEPSAFDTDSDDNVPVGYDPTEYRRAGQDYHKELLKRSIDALEKRVEGRRMEVETLREEVERDEETLTVVQSIPQLRKDLACKAPIQAYLLMKRATDAALSSQAGAQPAAPTDPLSSVRSETLGETVKPEGSDGGEEA